MLFCDGTRQHGPPAHFQHCRHRFTMYTNLLNAQIVLYCINKSQLQMTN